MRALITGASGFVGRHVVARLDDDGWDTVGIDTANPGGLASTNALTFFRLAEERFDLVVHAAASAPHRAAIDGEHTHMARNIQLDSAMFEWAVRTGQGRVIYLSSSAAYPIVYQQRGAYHEHLYESMIDPDDPETPDSVYGWTKLIGERMAAEARKDGLKVTVVRPFSGYGGDQAELFPFRAIIERARRREDPLDVWGDGSQVRDWIHISDVVAGMLAVAENGTEQPVNLCTGVGYSMTELALLAARAAGYKPPIRSLSDKPAGVQYRVGDPALFHTIYRPKVTLEEGVARAFRS